MNTEILRILIDSLGKLEFQVQELVDLDPSTIQAVYEGSERYFYTLENGIVLSFELPEKQFVKMSISLVPKIEGKQTYEGALPLNIARGASRVDIRTQWGDPVKSTPPLISPILKPYGGADIFDIPGHDNKELIVGYTVDFKLQSIHIALKQQA